MSWRNTFLTIALCFGVGLGLAPTLRPAHACSCLGLGGWGLALEQIEGDADPSIEEEFWPTYAHIAQDEGAALYVDNERLDLESVQ